MNALAAASLFDNPWVLLVILLVGALSNWVMKRRQELQADDQPDSDDAQPLPDKPQERTPPQFDLEEAMRQLLGGEPHPQAPRPPVIPPTERDLLSLEVRLDQDQFQREQAWVDEARETNEATRPPAIQTNSPLRPHPALEQVNTIRIEASRQAEKAARRFERLNEQAKRPSTVLSAERMRRSRNGARTVELVRNARTVRQALIASLVFGPPKAFES